MSENANKECRSISNAFGGCEDFIFTRVDGCTVVVARSRQALLGRPTGHPRRVRGTLSVL